MRNFVLALVVLGAILGLGVLFGVGTYNGLVTHDEGVKAAWSQVENVYQRRFDLIPNLVETVKGYAAHEKETFTQVTEARAKVSQVRLGSDVVSNPQAFAKFQEGQGELSSALSRLMVVAEKYPDLKANENFLNLQTQLEGTENRIAVERMRFNEVAQKYNTYRKKFPRVMMANMFGFNEKAYFQAETGAQTAPKVNFNP